MAESGACVLFLTTTPERAAGVLAASRARFPAARWTIVQRESERALRGDLGGDLLEGTVQIDDKPSGSKLAFLRALRAARFEVGVVAWQGAADRNAIKLLALCSGARELWACDENMQLFPIATASSTWLRHVHRRVREGRSAPELVALLLRGLYAVTLGPWVGRLLLLVRSRPAGP